jgi:hypothetical protein
MSEHRHGYETAASIKIERDRLLAENERLQAEVERLEVKLSDASFYIAQAQNAAKLRRER